MCYKASSTAIFDEVILQFLRSHVKGNSYKVQYTWHRPTFALRLSSALAGLTTVFGMGTGVPPSQQAPGILYSIGILRLFPFG